MKNIFTYLFLFFTSVLSFGQIIEGDSIVNPKIFWNVNDVKNYIFKTKETKKTAETFQQEEISYNVRINILDVFGDETTVLWTYENVKFDSNNFVNNPLYLVDKVTIKYVIDAQGRFLRFENIPQTITDYLASAEVIKNEYFNQTEIQSKIQDLINIYSTPENITRIFEKDIRQFHLFFGKGKFDTKGSTIEFNSYMDNLFSTSPTPAKTSMKLNEIAYTGTNYTINALQMADKEWLANSWFNYLKQLSEELETEKPDDSRLQDEIIYNVNTTSRIKDNGWITYSSEIKTVNFQDTNYTLVRRIEMD
ncbi:hypothetical protein [Faecalibacter bovis]|uniref:Uncharacterized protein n=1 Tax=Faecalibacter bovis TaxID=2898187 RepID=A0ABX7XB96_9FLAO|nr:hypothetical protein [Faecalibacter bovis]QTV05186.1 hypothetical protein J9309_10410 [Faecalibacter bovis]